jgi:hypothetical protein
VQHYRLHIEGRNSDKSASNRGKQEVWSCMLSTGLFRYA